MRRTVFFAVILLAGPAWAGNGRDIFQGVLQGVIGEIDRQQQRDAYRREAKIRALLDACFASREASCTLALRQPLSEYVHRAVIARLEGIAEQRRLEQQAHDDFIQNWNTCRDDGNIGACDYALAYHALSDNDRGRLLTWRQNAVTRAEDDARRRLKARQQERERQQQLARERAEAEHEAAERVRIIPEQITTASLPAPVSAPAPRTPILPFAPIAVVLVILSFASLIAHRWTDLKLAILGRGPDGDPISPDPSQGDPFLLFPLSGHFPTDIRRALAS